MLLVTGMLVEAPLLRITVEPSPANGLRNTSQVMVDKVMTLPRDKLGPPFGRLEADTMLQVERCLALFLGIAR